MRNSSLSSRSLRCFLNIPLCSGALFFRCHISQRDRSVDQMPNAWFALSRSLSCHHLDVIPVLSCTKNRLMRETHSSAQFLPVVRLDQAEHRSQTFQPLWLGMSME